MPLYLPIAEMSADALLLLGMGGGVGFLSGMFGVGGGFLLTPLLIFIGVPPAVAVSTGANQLVASSVSGALAHWRRGNVDLKMALIMLAGGFAGSSLGVGLYTFLRAIGQVDIVIQVSYVVFLGVIGSLMLAESIRAWLRGRNPALARRKLHRHAWVHGLPFKTRFRRSRLYVSAIPPFAIGLVSGLLTAIMGVGGGFFMVPAMVYVLGMPTVVVLGTSLFQIIFISANVTALQAVTNHTVDVVLAMVLLVGGVVGAQIGTLVGAKLRAEQLRALLGLVALAVCLRVAYDLEARPADRYSLAPVAGVR